MATGMRRERSKGTEGLGQLSINVRPCDHPAERASELVDGGQRLLDNRLTQGRGGRQHDGTALSLKGDVGDYAVDDQERERNVITAEPVTTGSAVGRMREGAATSGRTPMVHHHALVDRGDARRGSGPVRRRSTTRPLGSLSQRAE